MSRAEYQRDYHRDLYHKRKELGICACCGRTDALAGKVFCAPCALRRSEYQKAARRIHSAAGAGRRSGLAA